MKLPVDFFYFILPLEPIFLNKIIRIFCVSGCFAVPNNPDKWGSIVPQSALRLFSWMSLLSFDVWQDVRNALHTQKLLRLQDVVWLSTWYRKGANIQNVFHLHSTNQGQYFFFFHYFMRADSETQHSQVVTSGDRLLRHDTNHSPTFNSRLCLWIVSSTELEFFYFLAR